MDKFKEEIKNAICNNDLNFLIKNRSKYIIDERFEDEDNDTLLLYSISDSESNVFSYFLENGADYKLKNDLGENIVHAMIFAGKLERLDNILSRYKDINIDSQTLDGATPLLLAISLDKYHIAKYLINKGANIFLSDEDGLTPFHLAVQCSDLELVRLLVDKGAKLRQKTNKGNAPLALAANADNKDTIQYLFSVIYE